MLFVLSAYQLIGYLLFKSVLGMYILFDHLSENVYRHQYTILTKVIKY